MKIEITIAEIWQLISVAYMLGLVTVLAVHGIIYGIHRYRAAVRRQEHLEITRTIRPGILS
ncbi:MAG: hypothetical protein ACOYM3_15650 [Terrimicrobiaceae bacterium]